MRLFLVMVAFILLFYGCFFTQQLDSTRAIVVEKELTNDTLATYRVELDCKPMIELEIPAHPRAWVVGDTLSYLSKRDAKTLYVTMLKYERLLRYLKQELQKKNNLEM